MSNQESSSGAQKCVVITPVFNDWGSLKRLLAQLDEALSASDLQADVLIVDDASTEPPPGNLWDDALKSIERADVLTLACNLGHQRAIAVGLVHAAGRASEDVLVVMDGDGEDLPADVPKLVRRLHEDTAADVVFAERHRRSESFLFRCGYAAYRLMHWLLTGVRVRFGNFSAIRASALRQLVYHSALWNHYAAAVVRSQLAYATIPTARGRRFEGESKLNLSQLMVHGFSALSVFSGVVCSRLFTLSLALVALGGVGALAAVYTGSLSWPVALLGGALAALIFIAFILGVIALIALRSAPSFIPVRDAGAFIRSVEPVSGETARP